MNIPTQTRADYVAYLRLCAALHAIEHIPQAAQRHPHAAKAIGVLSQWRDGLYKRCAPVLAIESDGGGEDD